MPHSEEWEDVEAMLAEEKRIRDWHISRGLCPVCATAFNIWERIEEDGLSVYEFFCPHCDWEDEVII